MRQGPRVLEVRVLVPGQTVPGAALGAGQEEVPAVLQTVPEHQQHGGPRARAHRRETVHVPGVPEVVRPNGQPSHARALPFGGQAVRVRRVPTHVRAEGQPDQAQQHARPRQAVRVRPVPQDVLPTVPARQAPRQTLIFFLHPPPTTG